MVDDLVAAIEGVGDDPVRLRVLLDDVTQMLREQEEVKEKVPELIEKAFLAGIDPRDLYDRPYSMGYVLRLYREARERHPELPELARGPRKRRS